MGKKGKIVYLILGLGIGVILTNILHSLYPIVKYVDLSDDMIIERSKELGMVSLKESINTNLEKEKEEVVVPPIEEKEIIEEILEEAEIEVVIKSGESLTQIAKKLFELGIIDNEKEFIQLGKNKKLSTKFIVGTYKIKTNTDYDTIMDILTRKEIEK
ncbi:endolytic transglycosylase MltG [Tissierella pigra]|uniref:endolytic transglycosylase MltG n=1 Tax=Tissierella pigra TaxID=2607614 RepID=UPI001C10B903|nr:endolytic transglycosylase MltG [Tissierella pigra]MBU5426412.1 endolytic transglycosylase MltG [Tissierella pigra]